jgi:hypothetical protein
MFPERLKSMKDFIHLSIFFSILREKEGENVPDRDLVHFQSAYNLRLSRYSMYDVFY